jgi:hypothetical protein
VTISASCNRLCDKLSLRATVGVTNLLRATVCVTISASCNRLCDKLSLRATVCVTNSLRATVCVTNLLRATRFVHPSSRRKNNSIIKQQWLHLPPSGHLLTMNQINKQQQNALIHPEPVCTYLRPHFCF